MLRSFLLIFLILLALPVAAEEGFRFGGDAYIAGDNVTLSGDAVDDAFIAGNTVLISAPVEGSAHAGGRSVSISAPVGQNLYAPPRLAVIFASQHSVSRLPDRSAKVP